MARFVGRTSPAGLEEPQCLRGPWARGAAEEASLAIKRAYPILHVAVFDAEEGQSTAINLPEAWSNCLITAHLAKDLAEVYVEQIDIWPDRRAVTPSQLARRTFRSLTKHRTGPLAALAHPLGLTCT